MYIKSHVIGIYLIIVGCEFTVFINTAFPYGNLNEFYCIYNKKILQMFKIILTNLYGII